MSTNSPTSVIDLRSDTVTTPDAAMRAAMAAAPVGDDVYDEDPTVKKLEATLAEMSGRETGMFFPSGTQSNLVALLSHCERGEEYIVGQEAHTYKYEGGGAAVLGSIQPQPIEHAADGSIPLEKIRGVIKADDMHFARTKLLALENTIGGKVISQEYLADAGKLARENNLNFHLDGARVFNAMVAQGVGLADITKQFDSVSICLSKGLGAPIGSVLLSNNELIARAKRWRKMVGGGMRQVGILAAAGLYALEHNMERLAEDHALAARLASQLLDIDNLTVQGGQAHTNMVYLTVDNGEHEPFHRWCAERGLKFGGRNPARLVTHRHITEEQVDRAANLIREYFEQAG